MTQYDEKALDALKRDVCPRNKWIGKPENDCFDVGWNHCIDHLAARGLIGGVPELYALELEGFRDMVRYLLPLAKGYVHAHPGIRSTECLIEDAEAMLAAAPKPPTEKLPHIEGLSEAIDHCETIEKELREYHQFPKSFVMQIPARPNADSDFMFSRLFKAAREYLKRMDSKE